jgi:hypothetical protein
MWSSLWERMKIKSVSPFKKDPTAVKADHVEVTLHMPIEAYTLFRQQVEASHVLRNRRDTDPKEPSSDACPEIQRAGNTQAIRHS